MRRLALALLLAACTKPAVPAMHPPPSPLPAASAWSPTVVFVRQASRCDTSDHARIVDEEGRFVGALGPGTWFAVTLTPGVHRFAVWPGMDLRSAVNPDYHPVDVARVEVDGATRYVGVRVVEGSRHACGRYATFVFTKLDANQAASWMRRAEQLVPDLVEGQALLDRDADVTRAYFEMARERRARDMEAQ